MTNSEARSLAAQLNISLPAWQAADSLFEQCESRGMKIAVDNRTGDWVVLNSADSVLARAA